LRRLRNHWRTTKYEHDEVGFGERIDALQAAILGLSCRTSKHGQRLGARTPSFTTSCSLIAM
jgi:hypothetical protein